MSNRFIRDPREAVKVGDVVQVKVISVEVETKRIGLSMKALLPSGSRRRRKPRKPGGRAPQIEAVSRTEPAAAPADPAVAEAAARSNTPSPGPERRGRREHDRGRARRRDSRRPEKPAQAAPPEPKPQVPEPTFQEKIAILQSKFRGIN
jgi:hypothetical protein